MINGMKMKKILSFPIISYFAFIIISSWLNYDGYTIYTTIFFTIPLIFLYIHYFLQRKNILSYFLIIIIIFIYSKQLIYNINLLREVTSNNMLLGKIIFDVIISLYIVCYLATDFLQVLIRFIKKG